MGKKNQKRQEEMYKSAAGKQQETYDRFAKTAEDLNKEGKEYRTQAADYYGAIGKGGPAAQRALAPQVEAVRRQYRLGREAIDRNAPRGGARDRAQRAASIGEYGDVGRLFTERMDQSMGELANLGVFGTQAGLNATGGGGNTAYSMVGTGNAFGDLSAQQRQNFMGGLKGIAQGASLFLSSRRYKNNITLLPESDYLWALQTIREVQLVNFHYDKGAPGNPDPGKSRIGFILEDSNPMFAEPDMHTVDMVSTIGILIGAVKQMEKELNSLRDELHKARVAQIGG